MIECPICGAKFKQAFNIDGGEVDMYDHLVVQHFHGVIIRRLDPHLPGSQTFTEFTQSEGFADRVLEAYALKLLSE